MNPVRPITIAITAMGGQGGGVLAGWIVALAEDHDYIAQSTSVPGVAQRTGATVYYVELFPKNAATKAKREPVLALMPVPGDVDIVIASEMMEAGRALLRGFVSAKTTLIASTHRVYTIGEKTPLGDGRKDPDAVHKLARETARHFINFDMEEAANTAQSYISAVLFGALAGAGVLPFARGAFETIIRTGGKAVDANLRGFAAGFDKILKSAAPTARPVNVPVSAPAVALLLHCLHETFAPPTHSMLLHGLKRVVDFQDANYGTLYLDRMTAIHELDKANHGARKGWRLTLDVARYLALAMSFEDTIRVADLKTRSTRFARFRRDVGARDGKIVIITEFMHPRVEEFCDILPAPLGRFVLRRPKVKATLGVFFKKGRHIHTTSLRGFILLRTLAALKPLRRISLRYEVETKRIGRWLDAITTTAPVNYALACEIAGLQRLLKGYGDTHERGLKNHTIITAALNTFKDDPHAHNHLKKLKEAALVDEDGLTLKLTLEKLQKGRTT